MCPLFSSMHCWASYSFSVYISKTFFICNSLFPVSFFFFFFFFLNLYNTADCVVCLLFVCVNVKERNVDTFDGDCIERGTNFLQYTFSCMVYNGCHQRLRLLLSFHTQS